MQKRMLNNTNENSTTVTNEWTDGQRATGDGQKQKQKEKKY